MEYEGWINVIEYFKKMVGTGITIPMFFQMAGMLFVYLFIQLCIFFKIEGLSFGNKKPLSQKDKTKKAYITGHITIEALIAFAIAYVIIILRCADSTNYIWNMIIAPGVGLVLAILIDVKTVMKNEENVPVSLSLYKLRKSKGNSSSSSTQNNVPSNNLAPSINIQVNTGNGDIEAPAAKSQAATKEAPPLLPHIEEEVAESDGFNETVIKNINNIIDVQAISMSKIDTIVEQCDKMQTIVTNLQKSEMKEYQIKLKKQMYACLNKGFATPQENEDIESAFYSYTKLLDGNGEVKALHDQRYVNLDIHEDRRKQNIPVEHDRRKPHSN